MEEGASMALAEWPICLAVIICDQVIEDRRSGNKSLIGLFNSINARQFPCVHPRCFVLASLSGFKGQIPVSIRVASPKQEIARINGELASDNPSVVADVVVALEGLPLEVEGEYSVDVYANEELLASRKFHATLIRQQQA
jgi:hypothetical protein